METLLNHSSWWRTITSRRQKFIIDQKMEQRTNWNAHKNDSSFTKSKTRLDPLKKTERFFRKIPQKWKTNTKGGSERLTSEPSINQDEASRREYRIRKNRKSKREWGIFSRLVINSSWFNRFCVLRRFIYAIGGTSSARSHVPPPNFSFFLFRINENYSRLSQTSDPIFSNHCILFVQYFRLKLNI